MAKKIIPDQNTWQYWMIAASWTEFEAALILSGIIPSEINIHDLTAHGWAIDPSIDDLRGLIKRKFGKMENILPGQLLDWAIGVDLHIDEKVVAAAVEEKVISRRSMNEPSENQQGKHWAEKRAHVLKVALQIINSTPPEYAGKLFHKKDGRIHLTNLAEAVKKNGRAASGKEIEISVDKVYETLQEAIKGKN